MRRERLLPSVLVVLVIVSVFPGLAGADEVITLGAAVSQTGMYALNGVNTKHGYDLAVAKVNEKGGIEIEGRPHKLAIRYYDDESTPARGIELAERLITEDGVNFMLGPYGSGQTKAMLPIIEKYGVPMVEGNSATRELFGKGYTNIFAVSAASDQYFTEAIDLAADNAESLGKPPRSITVALAVENDMLGQDVRAGVFDDVEAHGMRIIIDDQLSPELNDMSVTLAKVKLMHPDLLIISGQEPGAVTAVTQMRAMRVYVPMLAMTHCESARLAETLARESEHAFCPNQWHPSLDFRDEWFGSAADFAKLYRQTYGGEASYQAAQSAAAVLVFADAFARANSLEREKVREALRQTERETFFGRIKFDRTGRNVAKPMVLTQLRDGGYVVVKTRARPGEEPIIPRPRQ